MDIQLLEEFRDKTWTRDVRRKRNVGALGAVMLGMRM
jgi:hypothetical protein